MTTTATEIVYRLPQERRLVTELPGPRSVELGRRRHAAVAGGVSSILPSYAADGDGGVLVDVDGNSLIDLGSGIAVTSVGSANQAVASAVAEQAGHLIHTCFMVAPYDSYVAVAEKLNALTPGEHDKRTALFNSGAEAVENAVKVARLATGRNAVVAFDHAYHGRTNLTMALTAKNRPYKENFGPFTPEVYRMPMSYPFRDQFGNDGVAAANHVISLMSTQIGADSLAGIIIEPIQGEGGFIVPARGFLPTLATWCRENGVVFIADEVQAGFARTGTWFACEDEGVVPDLITMAKGIAGGMPLSALTGRAELLDAVHPSGLGGTYGGNPVACAAALAAIEQMQTLDLAGRARQIGEIITEVLSSTAEELAAQGIPAIGEIRGRGAMIAIELVEADGTTPNTALTKKVAAACHAQGVIVLTCGTFGNVVRLLPPLVIGDDLLREGLEVLADAIKANA